MTDHEIQLLVLGIQAGMLLMLLMQILFSLIDDRRDRGAVRGVRDLAAKYRATDGWRDALTAPERS